jgi:hypothetical protein
VCIDATSAANVTREKVEGERGERACLRQEDADGDESAVEEEAHDVGGEHARAEEKHRQVPAPGV